jgi:phosphopantetheine adenylyltransferase/dephospho-CoA kinase
MTGRPFSLVFLAGWQSEVHEIWGAFIDRNEAVKRIVERDGKSEDQASARLNNQMSNRDMISKCNTVFYTKWDYNLTRAQVDKAWKRVSSSKISSK